MSAKEWWRAMVKMISIIFEWGGPFAVEMCFRFSLGFSTDSHIAFFALEIVNIVPPLTPPFFYSPKKTHFQNARLSDGQFYDCKILNVHVKSRINGVRTACNGNFGERASLNFVFSFASTNKNRMKHNAWLICPQAARCWICTVLIWWSTWKS